MEIKILDSLWWNPRYNRNVLDVTDRCIGVIAFESGSGWKCYIGYGEGSLKAHDTMSIYQSGMPFGSKEAACALFPQLDPDKFVY